MLVTGALVVPASLAPGPGTPRAAAAAASDPVPVLVDGYDPRTAVPGGILRLRGRITNRTQDTLTDLDVTLRLSPRPLERRGQLEQVAAGVVGVRDGVRLLDTRLPVQRPPAAGESVGWALDVPVDTLGLTTPGVYAIGVEARGRRDDGPRRRLGLTKTFVPWLPEPVAPTRVTWLWPLVSEPRRGADGQFLGDELAGELAPGGRLSELLDAGTGQPVTWVVDPELLAAAADMADGYRVRTRSGVRTGSGEGAASGWLDRLRSATRTAQVVALPYADPDLVALVRAGRATDVAAARAAAAVAADVLGRPVATDVVWPEGGQADLATLEQVRESGARLAVLASDALRPSRAGPTVTGRASVGLPGPDLPAVLLDPGLQATLATADSGPLTAARLLAETAMISLENPRESRAVLVAPPRRWAALSGLPATVLGASRSAPWVVAQGLAALRTMPVPPIAREPLTYSPAAGAAELTPSYLADVAATRRSAEAFLGILARPTGSRTRYGRVLLAATSTAFRTDLAGGQALLRSVARDVSARSRRVRIVSRSLVTLSSTTGVVPLTVANDLSEPVTVSIRLTPRNPARLRIEVPEPRTIQGGRKVQLEVPARASANGLVVVDTVLTSTRGDPVGEVFELRVRATNYGTVGVLVVAGALALLLLAVAVRLFRRARRRGSAPEPPQPAPASDDERVGA